jgi:hypothetical protein
MAVGEAMRQVASSRPAGTAPVAEADVKKARGG